MRISDWSSDVCSSDLRFFEITAALRERIDEVLVIGRQPLRAQNTAREPVADHQQRRRHRDRADRQQHAAITIGEREAERGRKRSEEPTSELQSLMRISYAVFCLKKKNSQITNTNPNTVN